LQIPLCERGLATCGMVQRNKVDGALEGSAFCSCGSSGGGTIVHPVPAFPDSHLQDGGLLL